MEADENNIQQLEPIRNPKKGIDGEVLLLDNLNELNVSQQAFRIGYNAVVHCRRGCIQIEMADHRQVNVRHGQLLLLPANKLVQPMMVSTDVDASVLLVSDHVLKLVLGKLVNIWNKAMYMEEIYVLDGGPWVQGIMVFADTIFKDKDLELHNELTITFLRMLMLMLCESLAKQTKLTSAYPDSTGNKKAIFNSFLALLAKEPNKRQRVSYYANQLNISSKYLSSVCKSVSDKTPLHWIKESVMEECCLLLVSTDLSVKEISNRLGFPNSSFFGHYFRKQMGMTPIEYRSKSEK